MSEQPGPEPGPIELGPFELDPSVRRVGPGARLLLGGSPTRLLRLSEAGAELLDRLAAGETVRGTRGVRALVDRLVAGGLAHPVPAPVHAEVADELTVVIPVRDHAAQLDRLLCSLAACRPAPARVVVVDDGSSTPLQVPDAVELVRLGRSGGPAAARNEGLTRVRTRYVAFVDADCVVDPGWLGPPLAQLRDPAVAVVAPRVRAAAAAAAAPTMLERFERDRSPLDLGATPARVQPGTRVSYVPSAAIVARVDVLRDLGGFDESMRIGEDVDLVWRVVDSGSTVRFDPRSVVLHEVRPDLRRWLAQRYGYGTSAAALDERHPGRVAPVVCSPWSALVWALVVLGRPLAAAGVVGFSVERLRRRLPGVPIIEVARLSVAGHASAGAQLARTSVRDWWPMTFAAALLSRRARRVASAAWVAAAVFALRHRNQRDGNQRAGNPSAAGRATEFVLLWAADGLSYGAGVWAGAVRRRRWRVLLPRR